MSLRLAAFKNNSQVVLIIFKEKTKISLSFMPASSDRFMSCQIGEDQSLKTAMTTLESSGTEVVLIVDRDGRLSGVMTDGDIRRALLAEGSLEAPLYPHVHREYTSVGPSESRAEVIELMRARSIHQIPVLEEHGRLVGLHLLHELIGQPELPNSAVIMAGGQGTRLRPITEHLPKPMIRVAGRPILERIILHMVGFGIRNIYLSVNYLGEMIENYFGDGGKFGCHIQYLYEQEPLGTGGPLSLLPEAPKHPILVMNGDLVTQIKIDKLLSYHNSAELKATIGVRRYLHSVPFGCIEVSNNGHVISIEEKPMLERMINAGIYVISPEVVRQVPKQFYPITSLFDAIIKQGDSVGAFEIVEDWIDVGQKEQLAQAQGSVN